MDFTIAGRTIAIAENDVTAHKLLEVATKWAAEASTTYVKKYDTYKTWGNFVESGLKDGYALIALYVGEAADFLIKNGQYRVSKERLINQYGDFIFES